MSLDLTKLENVAVKSGKTIARCPACAAHGKDTAGKRLVIFDNGKFGCAAHGGNHEHRQEIWRLAGLNTPPPSPTVNVTDGISENDLLNLGEVLGF